MSEALALRVMVALTVLPLAGLSETLGAAVSVLLT
jgi:hypothetical protein